MQKEVFTAALLSAVSLTAAQAQDAPLERHIGLSGHYVEADDERDVDYGYGFSVLIGHQLFDADSPVYLEGIFSTTSLETGVEGFTDFYQYQLGLDLAYRFGDRSGLTPFLFLGGGAIYDDVTPDSLDATEPYANAGLGFEKAKVRRGSVAIHEAEEKREIISTTKELASLERTETQRAKYIVPIQMSRTAMRMEESVVSTLPTPHVKELARSSAVSARLSSSAGAGAGAGTE